MIFMKPHRYLMLLCLAGSLQAAESEPLSAKDLAARLSEEDGNSYVRLRMEIQQPPGTKKETLQIQIKQRRARNSAVAVYQVLWPKERKGEGILVRQSAGGSLSGAIRTADGKVQTLTGGQIAGPLFGSDLSIADTVENFFAWKNQKLDGTEVVDNVTCQILESKPGAGDSSIYGRVRSWIDPRRLVPLRVEKYLPSGQLARRVETTRVVPQGKRNLPANLTVRKSKSDSLTDLDGSRLLRGITFSEQELTPEGLGDLSAPQSAAVNAPQ